MKKLSLLIVLLCVSFVTIAQDVIVKKDGSTIQSKVMEINETEIKYKKWSNQDGPLYSIKRIAVDSIYYQNGEAEQITSETDVTKSSGIMERSGSDLTLNGRKIYGEELRFLVGEQNYQTYLSAKSQMSVGGFFGFVFWLSLGATVGFYLGGNTNVAIISGVIADVSLPLYIVFRSVGKGRLNWVADDYNWRGKSGAFSYQIAPSIMKCNSVESQGNLGLGLTFSMNF